MHLTRRSGSPELCASHVPLWTRSVLVRYITFDALVQSSFRDIVFRRYHSFQRARNEVSVLTDQVRNEEGATRSTGCLMVVLSDSLEDLREDREPVRRGTSHGGRRQVLCRIRF